MKAESAREIPLAWWINSRKTLSPGPHSSTPESGDGKWWLSLLAPLCYSYPYSECGQRKPSLGHRLGNPALGRVYSKKVGFSLWQEIQGRWPSAQIPMGQALFSNALALVHRKVLLDHEGPLGSFKFILAAGVVLTGHATFPECCRKTMVDRPIEPSACTITMARGYGRGLFGDNWISIQRKGRAKWSTGFGGSWTWVWIHLLTVWLEQLNLSETQFPLL